MFSLSLSLSHTHTHTLSLSLSLSHSPTHPLTHSFTHNVLYSLSPHTHRHTHLWPFTLTRHMFLSFSLSLSPQPPLLSPHTSTDMLENMVSIPHQHQHHKTHMQFPAPFSPLLHTTRPSLLLSTGLHVSKVCCFCLFVFWSSPPLPWLMLATDIVFLRPKPMAVWPSRSLIAPATYPETDLFWQLYMLPQWERHCKASLLSQTDKIWHWANWSQHGPPLPGVRHSSHKKAKFVSQCRTSLYWHHCQNWPTSHDTAAKPSHLTLTPLSNCPTSHDTVAKTVSSQFDTTVKLSHISWHHGQNCLISVWHHCQTVPHLMTPWPKRSHLSLTPLPKLTHISQHLLKSAQKWPTVKSGPHLTGIADKTGPHLPGTCPIWPTSPWHCCQNWPTSHWHLSKLAHIALAPVKTGPHLTQNWPTSHCQNWSTSPWHLSKLAYISLAPVKTDPNLVVKTDPHLTVKNWPTSPWHLSKAAPVMLDFSSFSCPMYPI